MIKEALEYLSEIARESENPRELAIPDPRAKRYMVGKQVVTVDAPAAPRSHKVHSLEDLMAMVTAYNDLHPDCAVFANEGGVIAVFDNDGYRVNRCSFILKDSDAWETVKGMGSWREQKAFIQLLKIKLCGCLPESALLDKIRKITITDGSVVTREIKKNQESLGRSINSAVSGEAEIPDFVTLNVPVYKSLGEREPYTIRCSVEVDPTRTDAFRLATLPDEIERVQHLAIKSILERLVAGLPTGTECYYGSP